MPSFPPDIWVPIKLTIELATISTLSLLVVATPLAWWLARSQAWFKEAVAAVVSLPMVLPPTVLGFYLLIALGPDGPGRRDRESLWARARWPSLSPGSSSARSSRRCRLSCSRSATRSRRSATGRSRPPRRLRASPARAFWTVALPLREPGLLDRRGARLRAHRRRVRRHPDDRRQHPRPAPGSCRPPSSTLSRRCDGARPTFSPAAWWSSRSPSFCR